MIPAALILTLLVSPLILVFIGGLNLRFGLTRLAALFIAGIVWVGGLWLAWRIPLEIPWSMWANPDGLYDGPAWLLVDRYSWPLSFAVSTVAFASVLTALSRSRPPEVRDLGGILLLSGLALAAVFAGSVSALLLAWTAIDLVELALLLMRVEDRAESERGVIAFSARLMGTLLVLLGLAVSRLPDVSLQTIPAGANTLFAFAAGFRLGVLPAQPPLRSAGVFRRELETVVRLVPAGSAVMLLARTAASGPQAGWSVLLLALAVISGLYGAFNWLLVGERTSAKPFWVVGFASLVVASALLSQPEAAVAWGYPLMFGGALIYLGALERNSLLWLVPAGAVLMFAVPYSPTWQSSLLLSNGGLIWGGFSAIIAAVLLLGYLREAQKVNPDVSDSPIRGVRALYAAGIALIVVSMVFSGWAPAAQGEPFTGSWWVWLLIAGLAGLGWVLLSRRGQVLIQDRKAVHLLAPITPGLVYRVIWRFYRLSVRAVTILTRILEGRSAILWAILLLALLVSLIAQTGLGA